LLAGLDNYANMYMLSLHTHTHTHTQMTAVRKQQLKVSDHSVVDIYYAQVLQFTGFMSTDN